MASLNYIPEIDHNNNCRLRLKCCLDVNNKYMKNTPFIWDKFNRTEISTIKFEHKIDNYILQLFIYSSG